MNDGSVERFHEEGTLASHEEWRQGHRIGHFIKIRSKNPTTEVYPGDERTWRHEYDHDEPTKWGDFNPRWFLQDGTECTSTGISISQAYDLDDVIDAC